MNWNEIENRITQDDQNKWDKRALAQQIQVAQTGHLEVMNGSEKEAFVLSDLATSQMCQRLDIPVRYYRRIPGILRAITANYDLSRLEKDSYLLRGKGNMIRAFLSGQYVTYNNSQVAETVQNLLSGSDVYAKTFVLEETHMFVKIVAEEISDPETRMKAGVMVGNSEVGLGSVSVEPFVFRLICTNDLVVTQEKSFRHAHLHLNASEFTRRVAEGVSESFAVANSILDRFLSTREEPIPDPVETIRRLAQERQLSQKLTDEALSSYQAEPEATRFGVINAFTAAARQLAPLHRIEMERFAGTLLTARL